MKLKNTIALKQLYKEDSIQRVIDEGKASRLPFD